MLTRMIRSQTSQNFRTNIKMPERAQMVEERKERLLQFYRNSKSQRKKHNYDSCQPMSRDTAETSWRLGDNSESGRGFSHRIKSSGILRKKTIITSQTQRQNQHNFARPSTCSETHVLQSVKGNSIGDIYPLQVLNSMEKKPSHFRGDSNFSNSLQLKTYLKKGTSLKQSIIFNILRSKFNKTVAESGANYSGCKANKDYVQTIKKQIPAGLQDVIGPEEMFRMNNIFTGGTFRYSDLYKKVNDLIDKRNRDRSLHQHKKNSHHLESADTLRSLKRWDAK